MSAGGPIVVVTGSSSGIGAAMTRRLLETSYTVVGIDLRPHDDWATEICDVTDSSAVESVSDKIESTHGPVDAAVTAAGI